MEQQLLENLPLLIEAIDNCGSSIFWGLFWVAISNCAKLVKEK